MQALRANRNAAEAGNFETNACLDSCDTGGTAGGKGVGAFSVASPVSSGQLAAEAQDLVDLGEPAR
jgi:hypothetical protein